MMVFFNVGVEVQQKNISALSIAYKTVSTLFFNFSSNALV
jgi:hypothetical protein